MNKIYFLILAALLLGGAAPVYGCGEAEEGCDKETSWRSTNSTHEILNKPSDMDKYLIERDSCKTEKCDMDPTWGPSYSTYETSNKPSELDKYLVERNECKAEKCD